MKPLLFVLVVSIASVFGRVAVEVNQDVTDTNHNRIDDQSKIDESNTSESSITDNVIPLPFGAKRSCQANDVDNEIGGSDNEPCNKTIRVDNGTALILTPLIEQGRTDEARQASSVDRKLFLGIESYSGFLTVNSTSKSHLFFWYFPSFNKPLNETPWLVWLQGGPGCSSLTGLFDEIGPFSVSPSGTLKFNPNTWLMNHSLVFIDNPVGTGFSFTEHPHGYATDMDTYGTHLYTAVRQLVQVFPELRVSPLFVAGESYAGKYVPALAAQIHRHRHSPGMDINLKGVMVGNGYVDPSMIVRAADVFYHFGLLEKEQIQLAQPLIDAFRADVANHRSVKAKEKWAHLIVLLLSLSHLDQAYNFLRDDLRFGGFGSFVDQPEIRRALHVGDIKFSFLNVSVHMALRTEFLSSSKPLFEELLEEYKVLSYCGQLDQMLPCAASSEQYRTWQWNSSKQFLEADRLPYYYKGRLAGYYKSGGGLSWMVIRGAGHMVPLDKPAVIQHIVTQWTHGIPTPEPDPENSLLISELVTNINNLISEHNSDEPIIVM